MSSQGQLEVCALLQVPDLEPEQTEFYVVLEGSRLAHVTVGKRTEDGKSLCFTVPGESHNSWCPLIPDQSDSHTQGY